MAHHTFHFLDTSRRVREHVMSHKESFFSKDTPRLDYLIINDFAELWPPKSYLSVL